MESRLKKESIKKYASKFASILSTQFYEGNDRITGPQILKLCEIHQINLFILMHLFRSWEKEIEKLKSPFFNYDHSEVKDAMGKFHIVISNHIEIERENFIPIFENAVEKTLNLIFSPYHYYVEEFSTMNKVSKTDLSKLLKYIRINSHLLKTLIEHLKEHKENCSSDEVIKIFDEICAESPDIPEEFDSYLKNFSTIETISLDMIYAEEDDEKSMPDKIISTKKTLNEKYIKERKTLNDQIKAKLDSTLAEIHQNKQIESLIKSITVNQRFKFTKELFGGDKNVLENVITEIDGMQDMETAVNYTEKIAAKNQWNMNSEEAVEFMLLIQRRFINS